MRINSVQIGALSAVADKSTPDAPQASEAQRAARQVWATVAILTLLYCANVAALMHLDAGVISPFYLPDEAEYALVGRNLLTFHVFRYEGLFPVLIPPLYPFVVAIGQALTASGVSMLSMSMLNHVIMEAVIFPSYALARSLRVARVPAILIALIAAWTPNMWEAGHYLAEVIYYPLFVTSCVAIIAYFQRPSVNRAILTGALLGLALLAKNSGAALVLAWGLTNISALVIAIAQDKPRVRDFIRSASCRAFLLWPAIGAGVTALLYGPWLLLRNASLQACAGCTSEANIFLQAIEHPSVLVRFFPLFTVDLFLSVGVLVLPLSLLGWFSALHRPSEMSKVSIQILFVGLVMVIVVLMTATYSGYTMGQLRERHLFLLTPLLLALADRGLESVRSLPVWKLIASFTLVSLAQAGIFFLLGFTGPSADSTPSTYLVNVPWVYGLGFWVTRLAKESSHTDWDVQAFFLGVAGVAVAFQVLWLIKPRLRAMVLLGATFVMFVTAFLPVVTTLNILEISNQMDPYGGNGALSQWLISKIGSGQTVVFMGCDPLSPCSGQRSALNTDATTYGYGEKYIELYYAEVAGMYRMIPVPDPQALPSIEAKEHAAYLLSPVALTGLPEMSHFGAIRLYDLHEYRAHPSTAQAVSLSSSPGCYAENLQASQPPTTVRTGASFSVSVQVRNISSCVWSASGLERILVAYRWRSPSGDIIGSFKNGPSPLPHDLAPGQAVELTIPVVAPAISGAAVLGIDMVTFQGAGAFEEEGGTPLRLPVNVTG